MSTRTVPARAETLLEKLRTEAAKCHACPLWCGATQTVFGEGPPDAEIMLVGEQPGDREDREGRPFVGPGGALLDRALEQAGIERSLTYRTNVVKHFKYTTRGKRRIHQRPTKGEIEACRKWIDAEIDVVQPEALVCLGVTAARALLGGRPSINRERGRPLPSDLAPAVFMTAHPAAALRKPDSASRHAAFRSLVEDLEAARRAASNGSASAPRQT
jgi:DNA polymerase